jgi:hypothetical protein
VEVPKTEFESGGAGFSLAGFVTFAREADLRVVADFRHSTRRLLTSESRAGATEEKVAVLRLVGPVDQLSVRRIGELPKAQPRLK